MYDEKKLDNPVWFSLNESHQNFAVDFENIKFYHPDYCPFGGMKRAENTAKYIDEYSTLVDNFFIVGEKPELSNALTIKNELVCLQMVLDKRIEVKIEEEIVALSAEHLNALVQLVNLVQPGYFKNKTALLGSYFGIFKKGELIAVTGERMKMNKFVEVSAIITHPNHTRQGYARQLIAHTANNIFNQNKIPYLHVVENNFGAIKLYENSGFKTRRKISFWNISK